MLPFFLLLSMKPRPAALAACISALLLAGADLVLGLPKLKKAKKNKSQPVEEQQEEGFTDEDLLRIGGTSFKPSLAFEQDHYNYVEFEQAATARLHIVNISPGLGEEATESIMLSVRSTNDRLFPDPRLVIYFEPPLATPPLANNIIPAGSYSQAKAYVEIAPLFGSTGSSTIEISLRDTGDSSSVVSLPIVIGTQHPQYPLFSCGRFSSPLPPPLAV